MSLYEIPFGRNSWCGPAALAYALRTDPDAAADAIRGVSGRSKIQFTSVQEIGQVLRLCDKEFDFTERYKHRVTLNSWIKGVRLKENDEYVVLITDHYIVIHGETYFDNRCHLGKPLNSCPYLKKHYICSWKLT